MTSKRLQFILTSCVLTGMLFIAGMPSCLSMTDAEEDQVRQAINNGNKFLRYRQYEKAIEEYEKALKIDPGNRIAKDNIGLVHNNRGTDFFNQRKFLDAKREWELALKINPRDGIARRNLQVLEIHIRNAQKSARQGTFEEEEEEDAEGPENPPPENNKPPVLKAQKAKKAEKKKEPPPPAAVILNMNTSTSRTPAAKPASTASTSESFGGDEFSGTAPNTTSNSGPKLLNKTENSGIDSMLQDSIQKLKSANSSPATTTGNTSAKSFKVIKKQQPAPKVKATFKRVEEPPKKASPPPGKKLNLQDKITRLEKQVFGETRDDMPILKRIEQLEKDTFGKRQSGSIKSRVNQLSKTYGL